MKTRRRSSKITTVRLGPDLEEKLNKVRKQREVAARVRINMSDLIRSLLDEALQ